jgi:hypothetical protein
MPTPTRRPRTSAKREKPQAVRAPKLFGERAHVLVRADESRAPLYVWGSCAVYVEPSKRGDVFYPTVVYDIDSDRVWLRVGRAKTLKEALTQLENALTGLRRVLPNCPGAST